MGSLLLTFCSGAAVAAALTPGAACPAAYAVDDGISVTPSPAAPGSDIQLRAQGCSGRTGTASSEAFVADAVLTGEGGVLVGETRVRSSLRPGTYRVEVPCEGVEAKTGAKTEAKNEAKIEAKIEATLTIAQKEGARGPSAPAPTHAPASKVAPVSPVTSAPASTSASPFVPVGVGGGGAAHVVARESRELNARDEGPGTRHAVVGLVLAGVAALVVLLRGSRRGRGTE